MTEPQRMLRAEPGRERVQPGVPRGLGSPGTGGEQHRGGGSATRAPRQSRPSGLSAR